MCFYTSKVARTELEELCFLGKLISMLPLSPPTPLTLPLNGMCEYKRKTVCVCFFLFFFGGGGGGGGGGRRICCSKRNVYIAKVTSKVAS